MATVKFKSGSKNQLEKKAVENGVIYVTEDTQEFAVDINGKRIFPNNTEYPVSIAKGGTGANNAETAYSNLGGGTVGKLNTTGSTTQFLRADGTWQIPPSAEYSTFDKSNNGLVPAPGGTTSTRYLKEDGTWAIPTDTDTKVTETVASDDVEYPILTKDSSAITTVTASSKFAAGVTINPSTKAITATTFNGTLNGNATSATSATFSESANVATSASRLSSSKNLGVALGNSNTAGAAFDGSTNQLNIPVSGTLRIENGGTGRTTAAEAWIALGGGSVGKLNTGTSTTTYLRNDGTWAIPPDTDTWIALQGATSSTAGTAGYAPQPTAGQQNALLKGDGTWTNAGGLIYVGSTQPTDEAVVVWITP